jgi:hypothetical protein
MTEQQLPPLAAEDYVCDTCRLAYGAITIEHAVEVIAGLPAVVGEAVFSMAPEMRRMRPAPQVWSVTEYVCHLRDVYIAYTIRLYRTRTEERPMLEPMLNDLRASRFRYNERDVAVIVDELAATTAGFCDEIAHTKEQDWNRIATRLPGELRTARWLVRQAMHEGVHHLADIRRIGSTIGNCR